MAEALRDLLPTVPVTVFSDYICPFCYVGARRLARLSGQFNLVITHCPVEIHPHTPATGMPVTDLDYSAEVWDKMMVHLGRLTAEEGIAMAERQFTTNSHQALLLAEAAREQPPGVFEAIHEGLFHAFLAQGLNIGDPAVLAQVAAASGMDRDAFDLALTDPRYEEALRKNFARARQLGVTGVPAFLIGDHLVSGAVPISQLATVMGEVVSVSRE